MLIEDWKIEAETNCGVCIFRSGCKERRELEKGIEVEEITFYLNASGKWYISAIIACGMELQSSPWEWVMENVLN